MRALVPLALFAVVACGDARIALRDNKPPSVRIDYPAEGDVVRREARITLRGTVADADHRIAELVVTWRADGVVLCEATASADGATTCDASFVDTTEIVLEARDPDGGAGRASRTLQVAENTPPTARILEPEASGAFYSNVPIAFSAMVADAEDDASTLSVVWTDGTGVVDIEGAPSADGTLEGEATFAAGPHTVTLTVTDTEGASATADITFTVGGPNAVPTCEILTPAEGRVVVIGEVVAFDGAIEDDDHVGDTLSWTWSSDRDGGLAAGEGDAGFSTELSPGAHTITLAGADETGLTCETSVAVIVSGRPTVAIESPTSGAVYSAGSSLSFVATVADDDTSSEALTLRWDSDVDGLLGTTSADASGGVAFAAGLSVGTHLVTLTAVDAHGLEGAADVLVVVNGPPGAPVISLTPAGPLTGDDLVVHVVEPSSDPENDEVAYTYAWSVDGEVTDYTSDTIPHSATARGEVWSVVVTPHDPHASGAVATASVTILNTPPGSPAIAVTPGRPVIGEDDLTCEVTAGAPDADDDAVTYNVAWTVDGQPYPGAFPPAVGPSTTAWPDDTVPADDLALGYDWTCTVTARDDEADGDSASASTPRAVCGGTTISIAYLPGWGGGDYAHASLMWAELERDASTYGDCLLSFTNVGASFAGALASFDVALMLNPAGGNVIFSEAQVAALRAFAGAGGGLFGAGYFKLLLSGSLRDNSAFMDLFGVEPSSLGSSFGTASRSSGTVVGTHPITRYLPDSVPQLVTPNGQASHDGWTEDDLLPGARYVIHGPPEENSVVAYEGAGRSVYFTGLGGFTVPSEESRRLLYDALVWAAGYR